MGTSDAEQGCCTRRLIEVGLIEKTGRGRIPVPFAVIEADFALRAA